MNVLFFLLVIVFIYKLFQTFREGFDGNCYRNEFPNFRNSKLNYDEIQKQYDINDDISVFLKDTRDTDFSEENVMVPFNRLMEDEKTLLNTIVDYNNKQKPVNTIERQMKNMGFGNSAQFVVNSITSGANAADDTVNRVGGESELSSQLLTHKAKVRDLENNEITNESVVDLKCIGGFIHIAGGDSNWTILRKKEGTANPYKKLNKRNVVKLPCGSMDTDSCTLDYLY
jgi:hypothetical protein